jgi:hypothetical protein
MRSLLNKFAFAAGLVVLFMLAQVATYTTFAQWPASPVPGTLSFASDSLLYRYNLTASAFQYQGLSWPLSPVPQSSWSWTNQGTANITTTGGMLYMQVTSASGDNLRLYEQAIPSTPFTITALIIPQLDSGTKPGMFCGISFRESATNKTVTYSYQPITAAAPYGSVVRLDVWTNLTTFSGNVALNDIVATSPVLLTVTDSGTTLTASWSSDGLINHVIPTGSTTISGSFTTAPNDIGLVMDANSSTSGTGDKSGCTVVSWVQ